MVALHDPLPPVVGEKSAKLLASALGVQTVGDLLLHAPRRYAQRGDHTDIARLEVGSHVTVMAEIQSATVRPMRQRRGSVLDVVVGSGQATLHLTFFNQGWRERLMRPGRWGMFSGKVTVFNRQLQLSHPECVMFDSDVDEPDPEAADAFASAIIPIYPATAKLPSWRIAKTVRYVLGLLDPVQEVIPDDVRTRHGLSPLTEALHSLHQPTSLDDAALAKRRLAWDEAFLLLAVMRKRRIDAAARAAQSRVPAGDLRSRFDARLPFALTDGQRAVGAEIAHDTAQPHPMLRLLQGEVGSGKTVVALRAMLDIIDAGGQCALLAPTEVLAQQHYVTLRAMLGPLGARGEIDGDDHGTRVALLTGSTPAAQRREVHALMESGDAGIVIGTHALLEEKVQFHDLALVVIDEQHRFGVEQRARITDKARKGTTPHVLVMTATPIPRTAAITVFGDLDVSTLTELPKGRSPIASHVVATALKPHYETRMWQRVREEVEQGHQVYVVCPRISTSDADDGTAPAAAEEVLEQLRGLELRGLRVELLHGRMGSDEKAAAMRAFVAGETQVLVATTVIEVGVDVPNASTIVILDADRFGISQLHQLRGRVGRGQVPGLCFLHTRQPGDSRAVQRLSDVAATTNGFDLAQLDLEERGEGDVLGTLQSGGRSSLRLLSVLRDADLIVAAADEVQRLFDIDPDLRTHAVLAKAIEVREWELQFEYLDKA